MASGGRRRRPGAAPRSAAARLVAVSLSPSIDVTYVVDELVVGEIHRPAQVYRVPGGKGFNVARAAHALAADVVATGVLGGDAGAWMVQALARTGMRIHPIAGNQPTRTCVAVADASAGSLTEFYEPAPKIEPRAWANLVAAVAALCQEHPSWVSLSGSFPPGPVPEALGDLVRAALDAGARVAVDTHSTALAAAVGAGPDLLKVNVSEASALLGVGAGTGYGATRERPDAHTLATSLLAASPRTAVAVVTAGPEGCVAVTRAGRAVRAQLDVFGKYPVGSGDSFLGGLLTALSGQPADPPGLESADLDGALRLAMAAGAANALTPGAGVLDPEMVAVLRDKVVLIDL